MAEKKKTSIRTFIIMAVFFVLGSLIYSNTLYNPFIFDDVIYIVENYEIRDISNFKHLYGTRYITFLSFAINYYFGGLNPFGYHLVNILIHISNAILIYFLVILTFSVLSLRGALVPKQSHSEIASALPRNDTTHNLIAFSVSLIFLVHPIQTQAVTYITQRFTSLAAFFYLLAIVLYIKSRLSSLNHSSRFWIPYMLSILSTVLAMKTKEISFTLPFIIILYEFTFFKQFERFKRFLYLIPFLLTLMIIPLNLFFYTGVDISGRLKEVQLGDLRDFNAYSYLLTQFSVIVTYIRLLFFPVNQRFDYDYPIFNTFFDPQVFLPFFFLLSIFCFAIYLFIRSRKTDNLYGILISLGILWFFVTLSVESSVIPITDVIFEHRLYLPSIGAIIAFNSGLYYGIGYTLERSSIKRYTAHIFLSLVLVFSMVFSIATYKRNFIWNDIMAMALDELKKSPNKADVRNNIGVLYFKKGLIDKAEAELKKAITIKPDFFVAYNSIGVIYLQKRLLKEAEGAFKKAIELNPDYSVSHENLGTLYLENGLFNEALRELETALMLKGSPMLYNKTGTVYLKLGDKDAAINAFKEAIRLEPEFVTPYANMGFAYFDKGDYDKAMEAHKKAIKIMPNFANANYGLGEVYEKKGMRDKAVKHYKEYIRYADSKEKFVEKARKKIIELEAK